MAPSKVSKGFSWRALGDRFRALQPQKGDGLCADYLSNRNPKWVLSRQGNETWPGPTEIQKRRFETAAAYGARMAGLKPSMDAWLDLLKDQKYGYERKAWAVMYKYPKNDGGDIVRVWEWSAVYCEKRADGAGEPLAQSLTKQKPIEEELDDGPRTQAQIDGALPFPRISVVHLRVGPKELRELAGRIRALDPGPPVAYFGKFGLTSPERDDGLYAEWLSNTRAWYVHGEPMNTCCATLVNS